MIYQHGGPARFGGNRYLDRGWYDWAGSPPWQVQPANGRRIQQTAAITLPAEGTETTVLTYRVPVGWDGVVFSVVNLFTGAGFNEASGDITWRVRVNQWWLKGLNEITTTMGSLEFPYQLEGGGYRLLSGQDVTYTATLGAGASGRLAPTGRILCALSGWIYPLV
jgi:hypothetical protein